MRLDVRRASDFTVAENFDEHVLVDLPGLAQRLRIDLRNTTLDEGLNRAQVDREVLDPERVRETTQLWSPPVQRRLATFEARLHVPTSLLALVATAGGLATLAAGTATDPHAIFPGTGRWNEVVNLDCHGLLLSLLHPNEMRDSGDHAANLRPIGQGI